jgi:hypothetical protein
MDIIRSIEEESGVDCSAHFQHLNHETNPDLDKFSGTFRPCHYFDYIAGTSTGGYVSLLFNLSRVLTSDRIIAIMLGRLQWTVEKTIESYQDLWIRMADFSQSRTLIYPGKTRAHNAQGLAKSLRSVLNAESVTLNFGSDPKMCRT